jgi:hypothetical protein
MERKSEVKELFHILFNRNKEVLFLFGSLPLFKFSLSFFPHFFFSNHRSCIPFRDYIKLSYILTNNENSLIDSQY